MLQAIKYWCSTKFLFSWVHENWVSRRSHSLWWIMRSLYAFYLLSKCAIHDHCVTDPYEFFIVKVISTRDLFFWLFIVGSYHVYNYTYIVELKWLPMCPCDEYIARPYMVHLMLTTTLSDCAIWKLVGWIITLAMFISWGDNLILFLIFGFALLQFYQDSMVS